jgi:hypothetical protein
MERFVCKVCLDVDLCGQCFQAHGGDHPVVQSCKEHDFLQVSSDMSASRQRGVTDRMGIALWLQELMLAAAESNPEEASVLFTRGGVLGECG